MLKETHFSLLQECKTVLPWYWLGPRGEKRLLGCSLACLAPAGPLTFISLHCQIPNYQMLCFLKTPPLP